MLPTPDLLAAERIALEGVDAAAFAQAQFSNQLNRLPAGQWQFNAWLTPQGKVRALFHLVKFDAHHLQLILRGGDAATLATALQRFVLRSKITITALPPASISTADAAPLYEVQGDDTVLRLGCGKHSLQIAPPHDHIDQYWRELETAAGWPWLPATTLDTLLPASLALEKLPALAFDKGCYPGQEIVARLHYRGGHKYHLYHLAVPWDTPSGSALLYEDHEAGRLLDVYSARKNGYTNALAVLADRSSDALTQGLLKTIEHKIIHAADPAVRI